MKSKSIQFPFDGEVSVLCPVASWLRVFISAFFLVFYFSCGPSYGNEHTGLELLSVIALRYFVSGTKTDANQQAASQIGKKQVSPFCPACPGYPSIRLTALHPHTGTFLSLLAYRPYLQSVCGDE